jgi:hypothetical protein
MAAATLWGIKNLELAIPSNFQAADDVNLVNYLCGTTGTYASIRISQGQTTPWCQVFDSITIEYSNELWNTGVQNFMPGYTGCITYGCWNAFPLSIAMGAAMKGAPDWNGSKMHTALGLQTGNGSAAHNLNLEDPANAALDYVELNEYYDGTESTCTTQPLYQAKIVEIYINNVTSSQGYYYSNSNVGTKQGQVYEYQYSPGVGCTQAQFVGWAEGEGGALVDTLAAALSQAKWGNLHQDFFQWIQASFGTPPNAVWGIKTGDGGAYNNYRVAAYGLGVYNACANLKTRYPSIAYTPATFNFTGINNIPTTNNVPLEYYIEYGSGTTRCLVAWNTDYSSTHSFTLSGTNSPSGSVTVNSVCSANTTDNNEGANAPIVVQTVTTTVSGPLTATLNPHCMANFIWTTVAPPPTPASVMTGGVVTTGGVRTP